MRIYICDEIVVRPGLLSQFRDLYRIEYEPAAQRRGMTLVHAWQSPAGRDYDELPVTLYYIWSVESVEAWWAMRFSKTPDGRDERFEKHAFWQKADRLTLTRKRSTLTDQPREER